MSNNFGFIYAVCGDDIYLNELNLSLPFLQKNTKHNLLVLTDLNRNQKPINYPNVKHVDTPKNLNNHQASIFLKTSAIEFSPFIKTVYLDADTLVLNTQIDEVFNLDFTNPLFAPDLYTLNQYSRYALNNGILERIDAENKALEILMAKLSNYHDNFKLLQQKPETVALQKFLTNVWQNPFNNFTTLIKMGLAKSFLLNKVTLNNKWIFYPKTKKYTNLLGHELLYSYKFYYKKIVSASGFWLHKKSNKWLNKKNEDVFDFADNELRFTLNKKYGLKLPNKNSTISNGGVFGFTPKHKLFFNDWKNLCLQQFNDPDFRTRDQTALFVAQQKHKAQNWQKLPDRFNTIVDAKHKKLTFTQNPFTVTHYKTVKNPALLHFINGFNDANFNLWNFALSLVK